MHRDAAPETPLPLWSKRYRKTDYRKITSS